MQSCDFRYRVNAYSRETYRSDNSRTAIYLYTTPSGLDSIDPCHAVYILHETIRFGVLSQASFNVVMKLKMALQA